MLIGACLGVVVSKLGLQGYKSLDVFVSSCIAVNEGTAQLADLHDRIPTLKATIVTTARTCAAG